LRPSYQTPESLKKIPTNTHFTEILKSQDLYNAYIYNI